MTVVEPEKVAQLVDSEARRRLPRTTLVYLCIIVLSYVVAPLIRSVLIDTPTRRHVNAEGELNEQDFNKYVSAERDVRSALVPGSLVSASGSAKSIRSAKADREKSLAAAVSAYRSLSSATHVPNMDRRVLIIDHALSRPIDETVLMQHLRPNLRNAGVATPAIDREIALWRSLYGAGVVAPADVAQNAALVREMHLHSTEDRALADLYHASGDRNDAASAEVRLREAKSHWCRSEAIEGITVFIGFLVGAFCFVLFLIAAGRRRWSLIGRVATASLRMTWGDLIDGFLFYMAAYSGVGLLVGIVLRAAHWQPSAHAAIVLEATLQIGVSGAATFYLAATARRRGATLADIGLTTRGRLLADIRYGVLAYLAGLLPFILACILSAKLFHGNTTTTPNPILPLIVGVRDPTGRALIFLMGSLAAPLFEEIFFRGALFTGLRTRWSWTISAALSAACFALVHPMQDWLPIFTLGLTFATMREMRQSLVPGMTGHFLQNTVSFLVLTSLFS
jgi:membrane protease YdiL (CAAX protease family)